MARVIAVAKKDGFDKQSGLDLKRGDAYEIDQSEFDPGVFARPGEDLGEPQVADTKKTAAKKKEANNESV